MSLGEPVQNLRRVLYPHLMRISKAVDFFSPTARRVPFVAVIKLSGVIGAQSRLSTALDLGAVGGSLEQAFQSRAVKAVALAINSPGGSAAQSMLIYARIRALATETQKPVYAFAEDAAASGGYMLACAADEIYATEGSIVGSIGVVSASFGFQALIEKLGVERRIFTAGTRKVLLDAFEPLDPEEIRRLEAVQRDIHESFKSLVRQRRGSRLNASEEELFSGEFWTGTRALTLGLIDGTGDLRSVMRAKFGEKTRFRVFSIERGMWRRRARPSIMAEQGKVRVFSPALLLDEAVGALEARAIWSRFGL